jgi:hypothetical protein
VRAAVPVPVLFLVLVLAACGGSGSSGEAGKSAKQIVQDAIKTAQTAHSVRMSGSIPGPTSSLSIDLQAAKPSSATGTISLGGTNVRIVRNGDTVYANGDRAFWTRLLGAAAAKAYTGRWLKTSASQSNFAGIARLTDISQYFNAAGPLSRGTLEKKGTTTYNGQKVIVVVDNGKNGGTFYVAASGTPYPVAILGGSGSRTGAIRFSDWNQPVNVSPPKGAVPLRLG